MIWRSYEFLETLWRTTARLKFGSFGAGDGTAILRHIWRRRIIRERRRRLCYCNLLVRQMVQMKIKTGSLLMEAGVSYNKERLHRAAYFRELLASNRDIDNSLRSLGRQCREVVARPSNRKRVDPFVATRSRFTSGLDGFDDR
jgi:hypothetical protein